MKALVALALLAVGLLAGFAISSLFSGESNSGRSGRAFTDEAGTHYLYTLRDGDIVLRPEASVRCAASREGGAPDLFCTRVGGGRHRIILGEDDVLVQPLDCPTCGPDGPVYTYHWAEQLTAR